MRCNKNMGKGRRNENQRHVVVVEHVAVPDDQERLRRAYSIILQAAQRLSQNRGAKHAGGESGGHNGDAAEGFEENGDQDAS